MNILTQLAELENKLSLAGCYAGDENQQRINNLLGSVAHLRGQVNRSELSNREEQSAFITLRQRSEKLPPA